MILDGLMNNKNNLILKKILDLSSKNHEVLLNNIANAETPGFVSKKFEFQGALKQAIENGDTEQIEKVNGAVENDFGRPFRMDMNNVDVESDLMELDENRMTYVMTASLLKKRLTFWKDVFEGVRN